MTMKGPSDAPLTRATALRLIWRHVGAVLEAALDAHAPPLVGATAADTDYLRAAASSVRRMAAQAAARAGQRRRP